MSGISALGRAATYSASKFAVRGFMEALREELRLDGLSEKIHTSTIFPYFIVTRKDMIDHMRQTEWVGGWFRKLTDTQEFNVWVVLVPLQLFR